LRGGVELPAILQRIPCRTADETGPVRRGGARDRRDPFARRAVAGRDAAATPAGRPHPPLRGTARRQDSRPRRLLDPPGHPPKGPGPQGHRHAGGPGRHDAAGGYAAGDGRAAADATPRRRPAGGPRSPGGEETLTLGRFANARRGATSLTRRRRALRWRVRLVAPRHPTARRLKFLLAPAWPTRASASWRTPMTPSSSARGRCCGWPASATGRSTLPP